MGSLNRDALNGAAQFIGEAALDPTRWPVVMDAICRAAKTTGAGLVQSDVRTRDIPMTESAVEMFDAYFRNGLHINDVTAIWGAPLILAGAPAIGDLDLFSSEREMLRYPVYANREKYGLRYWAAIGVMAGSSLWGLSLQRTPAEGPFERSELRALGALSRRLSEAATLSTLVGRAVLSGITNALNLVQQPAIALDRLGFVIDSNDVANALFDRDICVRQDRLAIRDKHAAAALSQLFDRIRATPDTAVLPASPIVVRREGRTPLIVRTLPVDAAARSPFLGARVVLTLSAFGVGHRLEPASLMQAFGLTAAEARLAALLADGVSLDGASERLSISRTTGRNQLKAIFAKTGTHRQGELVALLRPI